MFRFLGGALGIAILVAVFDDAGGMASPEAFSSGFTLMGDPRFSSAAGRRLNYGALDHDRAASGGLRGPKLLLQGIDQFRGPSRLYGR
jgi:hypothetical protein